MLTELKDQFAGVEVLAYLDDVILVGKYDRCLAALDQLINDAADMKLEVQPDKCEVLIPTSLEPEAQKILFDKELCLVRGALPCWAQSLALNTTTSDTGPKAKSTRGRRRFR
jgi:hypothetical protein